MDDPETPSPFESSDLPELDPLTMHPYGHPVSRIAHGEGGAISPQRAWTTGRSIITPDGYVLRLPQESAASWADDFDETTAEPKWVVELKAKAAQRTAHLPKRILSKSASLTRQASSPSPEDPRSNGGIHPSNDPI